MAVGSGIGGSLGFVNETTYNTGVVTTKYLPVNKAEVKFVKGVAQGTGIVAGQLVNSSAQRVLTTRQGTASVEIDVQANTMGLLLQQLMGTSVTPTQQGTTTAYLQTHTLADPVGKSLTMQVGVPQTSGVVVPYTATGCKITEAAFSFDITSTSPIKAALTIDAANVVSSVALAAPSYASPLPRPFVGTDVTVKAGTYGSEASVNGVTKIEVKIPRPMKTTRFYFGNSGIKQEPITNDRAKITGTITADFVDRTLWADRFEQDSGFSLVIQATGPVISGAYSQQFTITLPTCYLDGDTPLLSGEDVVSGAFPFTYLFNGTNYPVITYQSTDTTL